MLMKVDVSIIKKMEILLNFEKGSKQSGNVIVAKEFYIYVAIHLKEILRKKEKKLFQENWSQKHFSFRSVSEINLKHAMPHWN